LESKNTQKIYATEWNEEVILGITELEK